jgi:hypothetical protein
MNTAIIMLPAAASLSLLLLLLIPGADPNYVNGAGDLTLFWAIDGGAATIKLLIRWASGIYVIGF